MQVSTVQPVKAFDLLPVIDYKATSGKPTCISVAGNDIYIGYSTGHVRHFLMSSATSNNRTKYQVRYLDQMIGSAKRAVNQIIVTPTIARIIGLAENQVFVGDMFSMVGAQSYQRSTPKSVNYITVNETSSSYELEIAVCLSRKKSILLMIVTTERFITKQEITNLQSSPQKVFWSGSVLLLAYDSYYSVYNLMSRTELELFPYNPTTTSSLFKCLSEGEFYMNADGLGMIVNQSGDVCRAPIAWVNQPCFVCHSAPYIVGISQSSIQVYSLLDQQLKQKSNFTEACAASDFGGNVFVVTEEQIYMLLPVPAEQQVERLIDSGHLEQAMELADETLGTLTRSIVKMNKLKLLRQKTAYMYLERGALSETGRAGVLTETGAGALSEAFTLFSRTQTPATDIVNLYDTLVAEPTNIPYLRKQPVISALPPPLQLQYHTALLHYISKSTSKSEEIHTQELKLICMTDRSRISDFIQENRPLLMKEVVVFLSAQGLFYHLGQYYAQFGFVGDALEQWKKLELGEVSDISYPGIDCIVDLLLSTDIQSVIMDNIAWLVTKNPEKGLELLVNTGADLNYDVIVELLSDKQTYLILFLEHIVVTQNTAISRYHTHLAQQYLSILQDPATPRDIALDTRVRFQQHLLTSDKYAVSLILNKLENTLFKKELAILYGKLKEHKKALTVLVYDLQDVGSAEEYCREWPSGRESLHLLLLTIYLECRTDQQDNLLARAVDFLNNKDSVFNFSDVYKVIPKHWPIAIIEPFVYRSLGYQAHDYRTSRIVKGLTELEWARAKSTRAELTKKLVRVSAGTYCSFCYHPFSEPSCAVLPSGDVYHPQCLKQVT